MARTITARTTSWEQGMRRQLNWVKLWRCESERNHLKAMANVSIYCCCYCSSFSSLLSLCLSLSAMQIICITKSTWQQHEKSRRLRLQPRWKTTTTVNTSNNFMQLSHCLFTPASLWPTTNWLRPHPLRMGANEETKIMAHPQRLETEANAVKQLAYSGAF